jgi:ribosome-binding protein aMBF1 (putative translation factor)
LKSRKIERAVTFGNQPEATNRKKKTGNGNVFESEIKSLSLGTVIQEARKFRQLTQQALALKSDTTKSYISRIENGGSDIRFSTLMKIIHEGLGAKLNFSIETTNESL